MEQETIVTLTADIVSAHVANNNVAVGDVAILVQTVFDSLSRLSAPAQEPEAKKVPAVSVRSSVKPDYLVCLECGKKQKTLRRHLQTAHGLSATQYREDYSLPADYPLVAPEYSKRRGEMARSIGLGTKGRQSSPAPAGAAASTKGGTKRAGRTKG